MSVTDKQEVNNFSMFPNEFNLYLILTCRVRVFLFPSRQATKLALLLRARADFSLFLENFKRGRVRARARVIDLHYSLSYVHVCAILSKDPSSGG